MIFLYAPDEDRRFIAGTGPVRAMKTGEETRGETRAGQDEIEGVHARLACQPRRQGLATRNTISTLRRGDGGPWGDARRSRRGGRLGER